MDHGPDFDGQALDAWTHTVVVRPAFMRPGKPIEKAYIESFTGRFHDECLNEHYFVTMKEARRIIESWRIEYNTD